MPGVDRFTLPGREDMLEQPGSENTVPAGGGTGGLTAVDAGGGGVTTGADAPAFRVWARLFSALSP